MTQAIAYEKAPVVGATEAGVEQYPTFTTAAGAVSPSVFPKVDLHGIVTTTRAVATGFLLLATTGFAEYHPCLALLLALLALALAPIWPRTGDTFSSSIAAAPTRTPCFSTGHPSLTADTSATGYHGRPEAMNLNHSTGGDAR